MTYKSGTKAFKPFCMAFTNFNTIFYLSLKPNFKLLDFQIDYQSYQYQPNKIIINLVK